MPAELWSVALKHPIRRVKIARESEATLVRTDRDQLALLSEQGELQGLAKFEGLCSVDIADDGSALATLTAEGQIGWLTPDLTVRWRTTLTAPGLAVAVDSHGIYLAASDRNGRVSLFDRRGEPYGAVDAPRPVHQLAFVPASPFLAMTADLGWIGCLHVIRAAMQWSDRPVANIGSLAVGCTGDAMAAACFSDGIRRYSQAGTHRSTVKLPVACGLAAMDAAGEFILAGGANRSLYRIDRNGIVSTLDELMHTPTALALSAQGNRLVAGFADGVVVCREC